MIVLVFLSLAAHTIAYPKWEQITVSQAYLKEDCSEEFEDNSYFPELRKRCDLNPAEFGGPKKCREIFDAFAGTRCYNQTNFTNLDKAIYQA